MWVPPKEELDKDMTDKFPEEIQRSIIKQLLKNEIDEPTGKCYHDGNDVIQCQLMTLRLYKLSRMFRDMIVEVSYGKAETPNRHPDVFTRGMINRMVMIRDRDYSSEYADMMSGWTKGT